MSGIYSPVATPFVFTGAYEALPSAAGYPAGSRALVTSAAWSNFYKSFIVTSINNAWSFDSITQIAVNSTIVTGTNTNLEQTLKAIGPFPANFFVNKQLNIFGAVGRNSNTTSIALISLRVGTIGSVLDTQFIAENPSSIFPALSGALATGFRTVLQCTASTTKIMYKGHVFDGLSSDNKSSSNYPFAAAANSEIDGFNLSGAVYISIAAAMSLSGGSSPIAGFFGISVQG